MALLDLAHHYGEGPIQSRDIASRQGIPEPYLNQLLTMLRKAGLINSRRGPGGGHVLARPAREIRLDELVQALEGTVWDADTGRRGDDGNKRPNCQPLREVWREVAQAAQEVFAQVTLAELLERERRQAFTYHI